MTDSIEETRYKTKIQMKAARQFLIFDPAPTVTQRETGRGKNHIPDPDFWQSDGIHEIRTPVPTLPST
jgi:hypothetical protein